MAAGKQKSTQPKSPFNSQKGSVAAAICAKGNVCSYACHIRGDPVLELMASARGYNECISDYIHVPKDVHMVC